MVARMTLRLSDDLSTKLEEYLATNSDISKNALIEEAIRQFLDGAYETPQHDTAVMPSIAPSHDTINTNDQPALNEEQIEHMIWDKVDCNTAYLLHGSHDQEENPGNVEYGLGYILKEGMLRSIKSCDDEVNTLRDGIETYAINLNAFLLDVAKAVKLTNSGSFKRVINASISKRDKPSGF